jgi:hypothetical protein
VSRRDQIRMSEHEVREFLSSERTVICATNGPRGFPHLMPLWYVLREDEVWAWTYAVSQKVRNLERDPRATLQVEAGETYPELRGVMFECEVVLHRDLDTVSGVGFELMARYAAPPGAEPVALDEGARKGVQAQAPKRVALQFVERRQATFDHRKLGGVY